jgi:hypothetical protein
VHFTAVDAGFPQGLLPIAVRVEALLDRKVGQDQATPWAGRSHKGIDPEAEEQRQSLVRHRAEPTLGAE